MLAVSVLRLNVREQRRLVQEDVGTVDALQVGAVGQLRVAADDVLLQLVRLAERILAVVAHVQVLVLVLVQVGLPSRPLPSSVPLTPQRQVLTVLTVSLRQKQLLGTRSCWG